MSTPEHYDAIIIGAGQAGTPLASALANGGFKTALIEREHVGGCCINEGCTPTKTMIASGRVAYLARRAADYGVHTGEIRIDMARVRQRKRDIVDRFRNGSQARLEKTPHLQLVFGVARFTGPKTIELVRKDGSRSELAAEWIFINAGCRPGVPALAGLENVPYLNSTSIMELDAVPEHLLILGGGYIGLEFGQLFRRLGSRVTIVQAGTQLLGREDPDVAAGVLDILQQDGVTVLLDAKALSVARAGSGIQLDVFSANSSRPIDASHLLVATGRVPDTESLNISAAGIIADSRGFIKVDSKLQTNVDGVYALGDIKGGPAFTHISYDDFRIIRTNLIEKGSATTDGRLVPYTLFIDPQLGRIGLSETEARAQKKNIRVAKMPMTRVARALEVDESRGFMKAVVDADSKQILGAAVLGLEGGEIMSQLQLAMMGKLPYTVLRDAVLAHPTLSESFNNLFTSIEH
jgi:pyruvate/2-oxoglutarate dehydrogenase complex dihydrolipoamide dehydrogenase (E3) component